jgi:hypothetical protein
MIKDLHRISGIISDINKYISFDMRCLSNKSIYRNTDELPKRIVAIGDIHGDFEALLNILYDSEVIDTTGKWIARDTFVVQTGDIFDKYRNMHLEENVILKDGSLYDISKNTSQYKPEYGLPDDELVLIGYLTDLHQQAIYGDFGNSRIILCLGNHEHLNTKLNNNKKYMKQYMNNTVEQFYGGPEVNIRERIFKPGKGDLAVRFACIYKICVVIGNFIFMHGGINRFNFNNISKIEDIEMLNNNLYDYFLIGKPLPEEITDSEFGILWSRELSNNQGISKLSCNKFQYILDKIGEKSLVLVIGHTPQDANMSTFVSTYDPIVAKKYPYTTRINSACGQRIYRIDTMMSRGFSSHITDYREPQYGRLNSLEINLNSHGLSDSIYNIYHTGEKNMGKTDQIFKVPDI